MNLITPKYNYSSYNAEYYYFKKESDSNFLLFEILKTDWYNITIYQTEKDEYLEIGKKKKFNYFYLCWSSTINYNDCFSYLLQS